MAIAKFKSTVSDMWRERILTGAAQVFAEKGFNKSTTKQIAAAAGVGEGTIYNYFKNKRELLYALLEEISSEPIKNIHVNNPQTEPAEFLKLIIEDRVQFIQSYGNLFSSIIAEVFVDPELREELYTKIFKPSYTLLEKYLENQIKLGTIRSVNPMIIGNGFIGAVLLNNLFMHLEQDQNTEKISQDEITEELITWFMSVLKIK
ncbi:MAG: TetR/AcrR family transcriptional regulator [Chloroflexi bacterium]|nr:TetR/AcrR family transcriptional regulator [Chloroflexota bacterium]